MASKLKVIGAEQARPFRFGLLVLQEEIIAKSGGRGPTFSPYCQEMAPMG